MGNLKSHVIEIKVEHTYTTYPNGLTPPWGIKNHLRFVPPPAHEAPASADSYTAYRCFESFMTFQQWHLYQQQEKDTQVHPPQVGNNNVPGGIPSSQIVPQFVPQSIPLLCLLFLGLFYLLLL